MRITTREIQEMFVLYFNNDERRIIVNALTMYADSLSGTTTDTAMAMAKLMHSKGTNSDIENVG